jgi:hypothetical protein
LESNNKSLLEGMEWALTPFARGEIIAMRNLGLSFDLALALIDFQIEAGLYKEDEIYTLPPKKADA